MRTLFLFSVLSLLLCIMFVGPASAINDDAWADDMADWGYRVPITITDAPTAAGVQRMITLTYQENMQADFDDIRFYTASGDSIDYWIEEYTASTSADVWVELPAADMVYLYVYYDNDIVADYGDGNNVFELFDDFDAASVNATIWDTSTGNGIVSQSGSILTISYGGSPYGKLLESITKFGTNTIVDAKINIPSPSSYAAFGFENFDTVYSEVFYVLYPATNFNIVNRNPNPAVTYQNVGDLSGWRTFEVQRVGSVSAKYVVDSSVVGTLSTNVPTIDLSVEVFAQGQTVYIDYLFVRVYDVADTIFSIGDPEVPTTDIISYPGYDTPTDPDSDGLYEDVNGNSRIDFQDIMLFFQYNKWAANNQPNASCFDWSGNGAIEFSDVSAFWESDFT